MKRPRGPSSAVRSAKHSSSAIERRQWTSSSAAPRYSTPFASPMVRAKPSATPFTSVRSRGLDNASRLVVVRSRKRSRTRWGFAILARALAKRFAGSCPSRRRSRRPRQARRARAIRCSFSSDYCASQVMGGRSCRLPVIPSERKACCWLQERRRRDGARMASQGVRASSVERRR